MINSKKIDIVQSKIKMAIEEITKEENIKIEFSDFRYNDLFYTSTMKVISTENPNRQNEFYENLCKNVGFTQNIIGLQFDGKSGRNEIINIKTRNRKYPVIVKNLRDGKQYKYTTNDIRKLLGGDSLINRTVNLKKLTNGDI